MDHILTRGELNNIKDCDIWVYDRSKDKVGSLFSEYGPQNEILGDPEEGEEYLFDPYGSKNMGHATVKT